MVQIQIQNYYLPRDPAHYRRARIYVNPQTQVLPLPANPPAHDARAGKWGDARLNISALATGIHTVWVIPDHISTDPVGPNTASQSTSPRIYRPLCIQMRVSRINNRTRMTEATVDRTTQNYGAVAVNAGRQRLTVRLRPVWAESPNHSTRRGDLDMIVVHRTGGEGVGTAMNQFITGSTGCHYIIGRDGDVVKMVKDNDVTGHAGAGLKTYWGSQKHLNRRSVGIENVGKTDQPLEPVQYRELVRLIKDLMREHGIPRHRVLGHSDIRGDATGTYNDDRVECAGDEFDWTELEDKGIGLARAGGPTNGDPVGTFFNDMAAAGVSNLALRSGDRDPRQVGGKSQPGRFGGANRAGISATPITQLQTWLGEIGYSVGPANGQYTDRMSRAVQHFQVHFLRRQDNDSINRSIAELIRDVRAANPQAD